MEGSGYAFHMGSYYVNPLVDVIIISQFVLIVRFVYIYFACISSIDLSFWGHFC